jgi:hypothetical protein
MSYVRATVEALRARGVIFEEYDLPGVRKVNGIAEVAGNYPSEGGVGELELGLGTVRGTFSAWVNSGTNCSK